MNIQDSPFHSSKGQHARTKQNNQNLQTVISNDKSIKNDNNLDNTNKSSFWDWFRGLVNPLQNLPLISGIYSSINSDDDKSDRDLVQNSLGGFMYGGPIGAIVGFGNWVFNKVFDKTPTEFALDVTGISNLWKNDEEDFEKKNVANSNEKNLNVSYLKKNETLGWWERGKLNSSLSKNLSSNSSDKKKSNSLNPKLMSDKSKKQETNIEPKLSQTKLRYEDEYINLENKKSILALKNTSSPKEKIVELKPLINKKNYQGKFPKRIVQTESKEKLNEFREINFDYPVWKPKEIFEKSTIQSNNNAKKSEYLDHKLNDVGSSLNLKL